MPDNLRFNLGEQSKTPIERMKFAERLAEVVDVSIQNSYGTAHRVEVSSIDIHEKVAGLAGDLLVEEIEGHRAIKNPSSSYVVIVGGDKAEDSLNLMRGILRATTTTHWSNHSNPKLNLRIDEKLVNYV